MWLPPAQPLDIPTAGGLIISGRGILKGLTLRETSGTTTALHRLRDNTADAAPLLVTVSLAPNESIRDWFGEGGILFDRGVFAVTVSGAVTGSVWVIAEEWMPEGYDLVAGPS